jgi:hypothetical protein
MYSAWRSLLIRKELTHDSVLAVLRVALASSHEEVGEWSDQLDPAGDGIGTKRKYLNRIKEDEEEDEDDVVNEQTPPLFLRHQRFIARRLR